MKAVSLISIAIATVLLSSSCSDRKADNNKSTQDSVSTAGSANALKKVTFTREQYNLADIETGKISISQMSEIIKLNGMVDVLPNGKAVISSPLGGYVKSIPLQSGQYVTKGTPLVSLENKEFIELQQAYLQSKSRYTYLELEYERQSKLRESQVNSEKTLQQIKSDMDSEKAKMLGLMQTLNMVGAKLRYLSIGTIQRTFSLYAPISGYIKSGSFSLGSYVIPTDVLLEIVNTDNLYIKLNAFEKDVTAITKGQNVKFCLADENRYERSATVSLVGKVMNENRNVPVKCDLIGENRNDLLPGMHIKAWIETSPQQMFTVPNQAIVNYEGDDYIVIESSPSTSTPNIHSEAVLKFSFYKVRKGVTQEGITAIALPSSFKIDHTKIVTKNAYTILSAFINSEEEE